RNDARDSAHHPGRRDDCRSGGARRGTGDMACRLERGGQSASRPRKLGVFQLAVADHRGLVRMPDLRLCADPDHRPLRLRLSTARGGCNAAASGGAGGFARFGALSYTGANPGETMMAFSATDAAFEGFRLVRRKPMVVVAWSLLYAVLSLTALFVMSRSIGALLDWSAQAEAMEAGGATPAEIGQLFQAFGGVLLNLAWLLPVALLVSAMLSAAVARGVLEPKAGGFGYLRLGK